jgi:hypothetical protein
LVVHHRVHAALQAVLVDLDARLFDEADLRARAALLSPTQLTVISSGSTW